MSLNDMLETAIWWWLAAAAVAVVASIAWPLARHAWLNPRFPTPDHPYPPRPTFVFVVPGGEEPAPGWHRTSPRGFTTYVATRHVRQVGPEGVDPAGGVPGEALCGYPLRGGNPAVPEVPAAISWPADGQPALVSCYHCARGHEQAMDRYEREAGFPPLPRRVQRRYDRWQRQAGRS